MKRKVALAVLSLAGAIVLASCGPEEREASLDAGDGGKVVSSPEDVTPQEAAATQDFWSPSRTAKAENNPIDLPPTPKDAVPGEPPQPEGGEVTVEAAGPSTGNEEAGGSQQPLSTARSGGGGGFSVSQLPEGNDPFRTNGKLLVNFRGGVTGSCSATMVNAPNQSLVVTAGHCVYDHQNGLGWGSKLTFVPGYNNGNAPFGEWVAQHVGSLSEWVNGGNFNFDVAYLSLFRRSSNQTLQSIIGARAISFNYNPQQPWGIIGYPAVSPYTGGSLLGCDTSYSGSIAAGPSGPNSIQAPCDFTQGASGGGWMIGGPSGGSVGSVTSNRAPNGAISAPYFGDAALALYNVEKEKQTDPAAPTGACLQLKKAQKALARAKARRKARPSPAAKRAVAKAKKALKKAKKKAKFC